MARKAEELGEDALMEMRNAAPTAPALKPSRYVASVVIPPTRRPATDAAAGRASRSAGGGAAERPTLADGVRHTEPLAGAFIGPANLTLPSRGTFDMDARPAPCLPSTGAFEWASRDSVSPPAQAPR